MQDYQIAWLIRYIILAMSLASSTFVIITTLYGRLTKYLPCKIIFMMQVCFLIVNINAVAYTDRFTTQNMPWIALDNRMTDEQPWRGLCMVESYLIHTSWMMAYFLSFTLVTFEYWALTNQCIAKSRQQKFMIWGSIIVPLLINVAPFIYDSTGFGFGPNGFFIPSKQDWKQIYFYCGWRSPQTHQKNQNSKIDDVFWQQMAYGLNYMLPLLIALILECVIFLKIRKVKKLFEKHGVVIAAEHEYVTKLHNVPLGLFILLLANMIIRLLPQILNDFFTETWTRIVMLIFNYSFDLIPIICAVQFYILVSRTLDVPELKFMCKRTQAKEKSLLTERSELYTLASPS